MRRYELRKGSILNRFRRPAVFATVTLFASIAYTAGAATIFVDSSAMGVEDGASWDTAFRTVQAAIVTAAENDEIWVAAGIYGESVVLAANVAVYGGFLGGETARDARDPASNPTVLDGAALTPPFHVVTAAEGSLLDGFTITGGNANSTIAAERFTLGSGGGIFGDDVNFVVANCVIEGNSAIGQGGGAFVSNGGAEFIDCVIRNNVTETGGAGAGVAGTESEIILTRCRLEGNTSTSIGGGLLLRGGFGTISQSFFVSNEAVIGGAIDCGTSAVVTVENSVFFDNVSNLDGAAISNVDNSFLSLANCTIGMNRVEPGGEDSGKGEPASASGGILNDTLSFVTITNSIVWGNDPADLVNARESMSTVVSSIVGGGHAGQGNQDADPRFRFPREPFPLELSWDSPAIDGAVLDGLPVDLRGVARPLNAGFDIGAYEFDTDSDGGGLPDAYETANGLNPNDAGDDGLDTDLDNLDNREEFQRGTDLNDDGDPPSQFFVSVTGSDVTGDGSEDNPWRTIGFAMASIPEGTGAFPITVNLGPGIYEEEVVVNAFTLLTGTDAAATVIQFFDAADTEHQVVVLSEGSGLDGVTVTTPDPEFANVVLVEARNVAFSFRNVILDGKDNPDSLGLFVVGVETVDSLVADSEFKNIGFGVQAVDASPIITRNRFSEVRQDAIFVNPPDLTRKGMLETPQVGDEFDVETGYNSFDNVNGMLVNNLSDSLVKAELNSWGVFTFDEIAQQMSGNVDFVPFLNKATIPATLAGRITDSATGDPLPAAANVSISAGNAPGPVDAEGRYLIQNAPPGQLTLRVEADGYCSITRNVTLIEGRIEEENFSMNSAVGENGEDPCATTSPGAGCGIDGTGRWIRWGDAWYMVAALTALLLAPRRRTRGLR